MLINARPGGFLDIIGQNPSLSKCNRLHVMIFQFPFIESRYIPFHSSKTMGKFPELLKPSTGSSVTNLAVSSPLSLTRRISLRGALLKS